jgi:hypothetical protein
VRGLIDGLGAELEVARGKTGTIVTLEVPAGVIEWR